MAKLFFVGSSLEDIRSFPKAAREKIGYDLHRVENGLDPQDWKPMQTIGRGVREIRIRDASGAYGVIYVTTIGTSVYVLHAFNKKAQKTSQRDIDLAKQRLKDIT